MNIYTKGPWHVEYELDENREKTDVLFIAHTETECDMTAIAHVYNILATDEENKANAYLLAAAPEMLEVIKDAHVHLLLDENHDRELILCVIFILTNE